MDRTLRYDHYKVLGVARDASARQIKQAYRERVKQWHPDRNSAQNAPEVFHALHDAYATLSNTALRAAYDERLQFYREARPVDRHAQPPHYRAKATSSGRDLPVNRFAFLGLHLTGLLFGIVLTGGIVFGIAWLDWPAYVLLFTLPGLAVIPDSLAGLRAKR